MSEWAQTPTGGQAWITEPERTHVSIVDISSTLSRICRFNGALAVDVPFYSVAQHSVLVSQICRPENALVGLLHDATEAYVQDIIRPLKRVIASVYEPIELAWAVRLGKRFGLGDALANLPDDVTQADNCLLATEKRDLMAPAPKPWGLDVKPLDARIVPWGPHLARDAFMRRFLELYDGVAP